jgi:cation-transporting ATPase I
MGAAALRRDVGHSSQIVHALPGRVRLHLPGWSRTDPAELERVLRSISGVRDVDASPITRNILIHYDPKLTGPAAFQSALGSFSSPGEPRPVELRPESKSDRSAVVQERIPGPRRRARIAVPDLDRDPTLAARALRRLRRHPGVTASANPLTCRVLVEYDEATVSLEDLLEDACGPHPSPYHPPHPLDQAPLIQGGARLAAAALGLAALTLLQLFQAKPRSPRAATIAALLGALQGSPPVRHALRRLLGPATAEAVLALPSIAALTFAGNPLGLALAAWDAFRVVGDLRAMRHAWQGYEQHSLTAPSTEPGATVQLDAGQHATLPAEVRSGTGLAIGPEGLPFIVRPGMSLAGGTRIHSGPITVDLVAGDAFDVGHRLEDQRPTPYDRYMERVAPLTLGLGALLALVSRSLSRGLAPLLLVNARPALVGIGAAETGARAQVSRSRGVVVGTRPERRLRKPDVLLLSSPRLLTRGLELAAVVPLQPGLEEKVLVELAGSLAQAAASPWSTFLRPGASIEVEEATSDENGAHGKVRGRDYRLRPAESGDPIPPRLLLRHQHDAMLLLEEADVPLATFVLRPRVTAESARLRRACERAGIRLQVLSRGNPVQARTVTERAGMTVVEGEIVSVIREAQCNGCTVAFVSDGLEAGPGFAASDLAIGIADGHTACGARADLLAPDLGAVADIIDACAHRDAAAQDAFVVSLLTDLVGLVLSLRGGPTVAVGSRMVEVGSIIALALSRMQFREGDGKQAAHIPFVDPRPERWGHQPVGTLLELLHTRATGLTTEEARRRRVALLPPSSRHAFLQAVATELQSPLIGLLAAGAILSLVIGSAGDVVIIVITLGVNVFLSAWQGYRASRLAEEVESIRTPTAQVLRDGSVQTIPADELVRGDVLVLKPGDRIAADARLLQASGMEVDEAALTGESLPVAKTAGQTGNGGSIVLAGTGVVMGTGTAVVVAVGEFTRMGAMAAALAHDETAHSPLGVRLAQLVRTVVPLSLGGGLIVVVAGSLWGQALVPQIALGLSIALAVFPEGLPLLAAVGQSAVASRLARRNALVRRVVAIEALGRVDVACVDKTGTLTSGTLAVQLVSDFQDSVTLPNELPDSLRRVLLTAALASPHPDAEDVAAHSTDLAIVRAAEHTELSQELDVERSEEAKFNSLRGYYAVRAAGRVCVKGAPEVLAARCRGLDKDRILARAQELAAEGLRVLMVAEGSPETSVDDPQELTALGFVGISDPLRESVPAALERCHEAGIRILMLTGDHPVTARTIARAAGLDLSDDSVLTGAELADLADDELDQRLEGISVIARATPFDKLRIVESLQRRGHTVAMTGDGVNDAPALRLADVGVAMGGAGSEVARQASDLILADDDFSTLVEALVEGRGFWQSIRGALGLLLGGNLGELALVASATTLGRAVPLTVRQILATNLITDALPALAVATQKPERRQLGQLAREGTASLGQPLKEDILRRAVATAGPSILAYLLAFLRSPLGEARSVAFSTIVATQLTQTLVVGRAEGTLTPQVAAAVGASGGALGLLLGVGPLRRFFDVVVPSPYGWSLILGGAAVAPVLNRILTRGGEGGEGAAVIPASLERRPDREVEVQPPP